ncbi:DUF488 family protein [Streptomyces sp. NPDC050732]|uniref:DUF488 family protein n=1 Tax=Streptomyces sp. NPDC050732 TaxID=3154632 RepID=UPI003420C461
MMTTRPLDARVKRIHDTVERDDGARALVDRLRAVARAGRLALLTAAKDLPHGHARVLVDVLKSP